MRKAIILGLVAGFCTMACAGAARSDEQPQIRTEATGSGSARPPALAPDRVPQALDQLQGQRLATTLRGKTIVRRRGSPIVTPYSERLETNGDYIVRGDRIQSQGTYEFRHDSYCGLITASTRCFTLHVSANGSFYVRQIFPNVSGFILVDIVD
ncbi:MAG TPA: hypothetical protein VMS43_06150 [Allosphingosinicella sp.]|nr:hypothetical protein [Allosphingosinicella sp.]